MLQNTMPASRMCEAAPIRVARKSEWLRCALAHHFNPTQAVENEIVVLATGIDQYLQEVFHHLSFASSGELLSEQDFRLLCSVLGLNTDEEGDAHVALPSTLDFRQFHTRLCGVLTLRASPERLPVSEQTEHVEREIRLRYPRLRRRKCVSFDLSREGTGTRTARLGHPDTSRNLKDSTLQSTQAGLDSQKRTWQEQVEMENASLRELVEDLRSALQSSDARCISLEVALQRELLAKPGETSSQTAKCCCVRSESRIRQDKQTRRTKDLLRELDLIRASRDGQLEEAMRFNQMLEDELMMAYEEVGRLDEIVGKLRRESADIKRRAEEARGALAAGLKKVRDIQDQAQQVTPLQERVQSLNEELERFRSQCTCKALHEWRHELLTELKPRVLPTGRDKTFISDDEGLQRAVEGRAASDEEEEERIKGEDQCCLTEVKQLINRLYNCPNGCQKMAVCDLFLSHNSTERYREQSICTTQQDPKTRTRRHQMLINEREIEKVQTYLNPTDKQCMRSLK